MLDLFVDSTPVSWEFLDHLASSARCLSNVHDSFFFVRAMLGFVGCIAPEILGKIGVIPSETAIPWFKAGVIPPAGNFRHYWSDSYTIFFVEIILMQFAELKRWQDYRNFGSQAKIDLLFCGFVI